MLNSGLFWKHFKVEKSTGDGHCLLYSVITSLENQHSVYITYDKVLDDIRLETTTYLDEYKQFINCNSRLDLIIQLCAYIDAKNYQTRFADIMPMIICNIIKIPIVIVEKQDTNFVFHVIHCRSSNSFDRILYIYKCGLHYDSLVRNNPIVIPSVVNYEANPVASNASHSRMPTPAGGQLLHSFLDYLNFITWNVYGLDENKLSLHRQFLMTGDVVLCLETWADKNSEFELSSEFETISLPRVEKHKKAIRGSGGICLFIRKSLFNKVIFLHKKYKDFLVWLRFDHNKLGFINDIYMACVYVAPERSTHNKEDVFFALQDQIANLPVNSHYLTSGDLNGRTACIPDYIPSEIISGSDCSGDELLSDNSNEKLSILRETDCLHRSSQDKVRNPFGDSIINLCRSTHMIILNGRSGQDKGVGNFTCVNSRGKSVVDYVLCSPGLFIIIKDFTIHPLTPESDHKPISFRLKCNISRENDGLANKSRWHNLYRYNWTGTDLKDIGNKITQSSNNNPQNKTYNEFKSAVSELQSPSTIGKLYTHHITSTIDTVIQKKKVLPPRDRPKWFDNECRTQRNLLVKFNYENETNVNNPVDLSKERRKYIALRQRKERIFNRNKRNEIDHAFKFDKSSMWPIIKRMSTDTSLNNMPSRDEFYDFFYRKSKKTFNPEFSYELEKEALAYIENMHNNPTIELKPTIELDILNRDFTEEEIKVTIAKLKNNKSPGPDGIVAEFLKSCEDTFARDLALIFNYFLEHREFPDVWAEGYRNPIFKAGKKGECKNYRGITVLCIFEKVFESACLNRLEFVSEAFCKFDRYNSGFMKGYRTGDNNFTLMGLIQRQLFLGRALIVIHIDFSQAFDLIIRCILFYKLNKSGFSGRMIDTLLDLYKKTTYRVKVGGKISDIIDEHLGVNQGGPASPFLFKEYLSDLKSYLDEYTGICLGDELLVHEAFADDMFLLADIACNSQKQLDGLSNFCRPNQMLVNVIKSKFMIHGNLENVKLEFQGKNVEQVENYKSLGTLFSSAKNLNSNMFKNNTEFLNDKARKAIFGLQKRTKKVELFPTQKFYLYTTVIEPILLYGSDIWGAFSSCLEDIDKIFLWYTKCNLGVKATTNDAVVIGESGMIPPHIKCHANVILNFIRLNNMKPGSIVKNTFIQQQELNDIGVQCWYSKVLDIAATYGIDPLSHAFNDNIKKEIRNICYNSFKNTWKNDLTEKPKLRTYKLIKTNFGIESYLSLVTKKKYRNAITRFRASSHTLEIERGRWTNPITPIDNRLCTLCQSVEDEIHFLFHCRLYTENRIILFDKINQYSPGFAGLNQNAKLIFLFTNQSSSILTWLGKFIYDSFIKRTIYCNPDQI